MCSLLQRNDSCTFPVIILFMLCSCLTDRHVNSHDNSNCKTSIAPKSLYIFKDRGATNKVIQLVYLIFSLKSYEFVYVNIYTIMYVIVQ